MKTRLLSFLHPVKRAFLCALLAGAAVTSLRADVPLLINYQGRVTTAAGTPIGSGTPVNRKVIFRIFMHPNDTAATARLWTEEQIVTILEGDFSVLLGQGNPFPPGNAEARPALDTLFGGSSTDRYLEITVDDGDNTINATDQPITPRQRLTSTGYAMRAKFADSLDSSGPITTPARLQLTGNGTSGAAAILQAANLSENISLSLRDSTAVQRAFLALQGSGTPLSTSAVAGDSVFGTGSGNKLHLLNGSGAAALTVSGNNVGIGTATPATKLDVFGTLRVSDGTAAPAANGINGGVSQRIVLSPGSASQPPFGFGIDLDTLWSSVPAGDRYQWHQGTAVKMTLDGGGRLGIGTTGPGATLDVAGGIKATGTDGLTFNTGDTDGGLFSPADGVVTLKTNNTERLRVDTAGSVGIGTNAPLSKLEVAAATFGQIRFTDTRTGTVSPAIRQSWLLGANNNNTFIVGAPAGLKGGYFNGNVDGAYVQDSDARLKKDVETLNGMLGKAMQLRPVSYHFKVNAGNAPLSVGFIAQEVEKILPNMVYEQTGYKGLSYASFTPVAIGAIQELKKEKDAEIKARDEKIAALESRLTDVAAQDKEQEARLLKLEQALACGTPPAPATPERKVAARSPRR